MEVNKGWILWAAGSDQVAIEGMSWHEQGCVKWIDAHFGSVTGVVEERPWTYMKVWVGIEDGFLTFDCEDCIHPEDPLFFSGAGDEEEAEQVDRLCQHAVAVALEAVDQGAPWYELPRSDSRRPEPHKEADSHIKPRQGTLLSQLSEDENSLLLQALLEKRPELIGELEHLAVAQLENVNIRGTAYRTRRALESFVPEELPAYLEEASGHVTAAHEPEGDDVRVADPREVLKDYSLRPLVDDIARRFSVGAANGGRTLALGIIKGLYDDRHETVWEHPLVVEYLGEHVLLENARMVAASVAEWDVELRHTELREVCPEWADKPSGAQ